MLQSMGSQRVGHDLVAEQQTTMLFKDTIKKIRHGVGENICQRITGQKKKLVSSIYKELAPHGNFLSVSVVRTLHFHFRGLGLDLWCGN